MIKEKGLVKFDTVPSVSFPVRFDSEKDTIRVMGIYEKFDELDCYSGKSLAVVYTCPLTGEKQHEWVCKDDNAEIIKVFSKEELYILDSINGELNND